MKFQDLPVEVQTIAAQLLAQKIDGASRGIEKKPMSPLAQEIRDAFMELYSDGGIERTKATEEKVAMVQAHLDALKVDLDLIKSELK